MTEKLSKLSMTCPVDLALALADQKMRGLMELPEGTSALVIVTGLDDSPLAGHHRDLLWSAFGLPVFEQLRGEDGAVIAHECEVHDGLHIENRGALPRGAEIVEGICDCGSESGRLRALGPGKGMRRQAVA